MRFHRRRDYHVCHKAAVWLAPDIEAGQSRQEYALDMIYAMLESDLDGENDLPKKAGKEICESCVYNPRAWRKE